MKRVAEAGRPPGRPKKKQGSSQDSLGPSGENTVILVSDGDVEIQMDQSTSSFQPNIPSISKKRKNKWSLSLDSAVAPQAKKDKKSQVTPGAIPKASVTVGTKTGPLLQKVSKYKVSKKAGRPPLHPGNTHASPVQPSLKKQGRVGGDLRNKSKLGFQFHIRRARGRPPGKKHDAGREIIRLKTTDGFWSSKTSSRSSSPLSLEAFAQRQGENKKGSRTSTPDLSGQKITSQKKGLQENYVSDTLPELRRLQTTKGFSFPDITNLGSRVSSRDESPSSSSSLDRGVHTNVRSQNRQTEGTPEENNSQVCVVDMAPTPVRKKARKSGASKVSETHKNSLLATPEVSSLGSSKATIQKPASKCRIKDSTGNQTGFIDEDKEPSLKKQRKSKSLPVSSPQKTKGRSRFSISSALKGEKKVPKKHNIANRMTQKKRINRTCRKEVQASLSDNSVKSLHVGNKLVTGNVGSLVRTPISSTDESIKTQESRQKSELFPLDFLDSPELKRLNTTAGFWAPTPNFKSVFGASRLRKNKNVNSVSDSATLNKNMSPKSKKTHLKPQTPLLQHRKKKLQALQNSLRKTKQRLHSHNPDDAPNKCVSPEKSSGNKHCEQKKKPKKRPKKDQPPDPIQIILDVAEDPSYMEEFSATKDIGNPLEIVLPLVQRVQKIQKKPKKSIHQKGLRKDQPSDPIQIVLDIAEDPSHIEEFSAKTNVAAPLETVPPLVQRCKKTAKVKNHTNKIHKLNISTNSSSELNLSDSQILQSSFQTAKKRGRKKKVLAESGCAQSLTEVETKSLDKGGSTNTKFNDLDETLKQNLLLSASVASLRTKRQQLKEMKKSFSESESNYSDSPETYQRRDAEAHADILDGVFENMTKKSLNFDTEENQGGRSVSATIAAQLQADQAETLNMSLDSGRGSQKLTGSRFVQLDVSDVDITTKTSENSIPDVVLQDPDMTNLEKVHFNSARILGSVAKDPVEPQNVVCFSVNNGENGCGNLPRESPGFENSKDASTCKIVCVEAQVSYNDSLIASRCETPKYENKGDIDENVRLCLAMASNASTTINETLTCGAEKKVNSCEEEDKEGGKISDNLKPYLDSSWNMARDGDVKEPNCKGKISIFEKKFGYCNEANNVVGSMSHRKDNLFESFGYDLQPSSKLPGASCVKTSAEEVRLSTASPSFQGNSSSYKTEIADESKVHTDYHSALKSVVAAESQRLDDMNLATSGKVETIIDGKSELVSEEESYFMPASLDSSVDASVNHSGEKISDVQKRDAVSSELGPCPTKLKQEISVEIGENNIKEEYSELRSSSVAVEEDDLCVSGVTEVEQLKLAAYSAEVIKDVQVVEESSPKDLNLLNGSKGGDDFLKTCAAARDENSEEMGRINLEAEIYPSSSDVNFIKSRTLKSETCVPELAENDLYHHLGVTDENRNITERPLENVDKGASLNVSEDVAAKTICEGTSSASRVVESVGGRSGEDRSQEINVSLSQYGELATATAESAIKNGQKQDLTTTEYVLLHDQEPTMPAAESTLNNQGDCLTKTAIEDVLISDQDHLITDTESSLLSHQKQDSTATEYILLYDHEKNSTTTESSLLNNQEQNLTATESSLLNDRRQDSTETEYILLHDQEENLTAAESSSLNDEKQDETATEYILLSGTNQDVTASKSEWLNEQKQDSTATDSSLLIDQEQNLTAEVSDNENSMAGASPEPHIESHVPSSLVSPPEETISEKWPQQPGSNPNLSIYIDSQEEIDSSNECVIVLCPSPVRIATATPSSSEPVETTSVDDLSLRTKAGHVTGINSCTQTAKKMRRRKRNSWQRGVVRKAHSNLVRRRAKPSNSGNVRKPKPAVASNQPAVAVTLAHSLNLTTSAAGSFSVIQGQSDNIGSVPTIDTYPPAVQKSLLTILKQLKTNANLANAVLDEKSYSGRFLRHLPSAENKDKKGLERNDKEQSQSLSSDFQKWGETSSTFTDPEVQAHANSTSLQRKRGRPKKNMTESLPKLTATRTLPSLRPLAPWDVTPPTLSPQESTQQNTTEDPAELLDTSEIVGENVDDSDFHLYLSGISDEELSPKKNSPGEMLSPYSIQVHQVTRDLLEGTGTEKSLPAISSAPSSSVITDVALVPEPSLTSEASSTSAAFLTSAVTAMPDTSLMSNVLSTPLRSLSPNDKEPKKRGRPAKIKGKRGRPPGLPMTKDEKEKKSDVAQTDTEESSSPEVLRMTKKSIPAPEVSSPPGNFSLRKKSTRSPLEMLELKRRQEEAIYDLEQERRQARLTYLREKRSTRESGEGFLDDTEARAHESGEGVVEDTETVPGSDNVMVCSVVLSDFVKKLQLNEPENSSSCSENEIGAGDAGESPGSGEGPDDENWCADLQQQYDDQDASNRGDSRPYIPRLKLKRILKKRSPVEKVRAEPDPAGLQPPPDRIKLVIKTEPVCEGNEPAVGKQNLLVVNSRVDRLGFESSFMDFLNGKRESLINKVNRRTKQNQGGQMLSVNSGHQQPLKDATATNSSLIKIIVDENSLADIARIPVGSSPDSNQEESSASLVEGNNALVLASAYNSGSLTSRPDEEDDDILILDLDESGDEITPQGKLVQNPRTESESVEKAIMTKDTVSQALCDEGEDLIDQAFLRAQRSLSNDEMGLMLESYYSPARPDVQLVSDSDKMSTCVTSTDMRADTDLNSPLQHRLASKDQTKRTTDSACMEGVNVESSKAFSETGMKEKGKMTDQSSECSEPVCETSNPALSGSQKQNPNTTVDSLSGKGAVAVGGQEGSDLTTDAALGSLNTSLEVCDSPTASAGRLPVSLKSADSVADEDSHATMPLRTPPKMNTSAKKPTSDSSRSPKQISCHGGGSEEWRVKVISQSDKCPSGKFSCKRCDFVTSSKLTVESHIYSHIPGVQFRCAHCQAEFSSMTATATHLKNTHSLNEAQLHISRHIEEKNFYEREDGVLEDSSQPQSSPCHPLAALEGQSPPLFISLVVSGSRASRTSAAHRFVCTHCGFSTNVKEAAEHHISDLHSSDSLYTCLLCSESCSEVEIKAHCAKVHPARNHPYKKLPDFYDAEKLSQQDKAVCQEGCEDFFERVSSVLPDEGPASSTCIDHRQRAKAYLELQEGWREKKRAEADSTTAADYTEEQEDEAEEDEPPASESMQDEDNLSFDDPPIDGAVNEVLAHVKLKSGNSDNPQDTPELVSKGACITSSAGASLIAPLAEFSAPVSRVPLAEDGSDGGDIQQNAISCHRKSTGSLTQHAAEEELCEGLQEMPPGEQEGGSDENIGLKIVQVVSLGQLGLDLPKEPAGAEDDSVCQERSENVEQNTDSHMEHMSSPEPVNLSLEAEKVANSTESTTEPWANSAEPLVIPTSAEKGGESVSIPGQPVTGNTQQLSPAAPAASSSSSSPSPAAMPTSLAGPPFPGSLPLSYKCNACKVHTPYLLMMVKHLKARHPNMRCFSCPYCKIVGGFVSQKQLRHHVKQAHPDKFGRNEIALSEDAKKFVEAMVLPMGLECIRVGNRIVLEEDIHTCTYCQIRMTSLTSVYEHLNTKHPDLFEYVCPICQIYKNSVLTEIANHCCMVHHVDLDSEQVHVSVPKNLFSILTCISKNGKYIEKSLIAGSESSPGKSQGSSFTYEQTGKLHPVATSLQSQVDQHTQKVTSIVTSATNQSLQTGSMPENRVAAGFDMVPRPTIPFSSALFDTSSFTASPHVAIPASQPIVGHSGAASSFLSPKQQEPHLGSRLAGSNKQSHVKLGEKAQGHAKNLPVLNVPTIRPRAASTITKQAGDPSSTVATTEGLSLHRILYSASQQAVKAAGPSSGLENIPDSEPSPDAFKIFNLRPAPVAHSASPIPTSTPTSVPSVFPPVSAPMAAGFIQGPIAGFPASMVIAPSMLPLAFPFPQHRQPMVPVTLVPSQASSSSRNPHPARISHPKTSTLVTSAHQQAATVATLLKNHQQQQQKELYKLRQQQLQQAETTQRQRQVSRPSPHQPTLPRAYPAHQQPPSLSGQVYQQNSHQVPPTQSFQYDRSHHHLAAAGPSRVPQSVGVFSPPAPAMALASVSGQGHTSSPTKPGKGMHKRSNCLYQCPYCPGMMRLKALEVASHIHQHHSGQQVIFRRIA